MKQQDSITLSKLLVELEDAQDGVTRANVQKEVTGNLIITRNAIRRRILELVESIINDAKIEMQQEGYSKVV